jgi:hypothetical protein
VPKGESGTLAGDDGAEPDSLRGDVTDRAGGRRMVMLLVTAGAAATSADGAAPDAAVVVEDGEKEAYLRSLPRPWSGLGPATVSSHSWSRSPMYEATS